MRGRASLRSRILLAFVITGAVVGPLVAAALLWVTYSLEEQAVARIASARLEEVVGHPDEFALKEAVPGVRVLSNFSTTTFPPAMFALPDGVHEYETDQDAWFIALRTLPSGRYAVVEDITALEQRERLTVLTVLGGTLLTILLAWILGARLSRRLVAPLEQLSEGVARADPARPTSPAASQFADREVATLAAALDVYACRMRESLEREREFSADVSHELRNPLAVIQNAAELIEDDAAGSDVARRAAARIREAAEHMTETVTVLLTLVREPRASLPEESVSVADCLESLRERLPSPPAGPALRWHSQGRPVVHAPRAVVEAIAGNLIRNAQEHSVGSRVEVRLENDRLVVEDDGVGMARDGKEPRPGRGVGLSLVRKICARFNWGLHIESRPGEGTRVEWRFNLA